MAFRGTSDKLYTKNNGKYLGLIQLMAKCDPVMQDHISQILRNESRVHYCSKTIANELIQVLAQEVKSEIILIIQKVKYFSIIADCTPDVSRIEQLSLTLRYVDVINKNDEVEICERFIEFTTISDSTGQGLSGVIMELLQRNQLQLKNCRGQGYDNGANMKGKHNGVQRKILDLNPLAFFMPCGCHSLNLLLCDAAKTSVKSVNLFGILGRLYSLFAGSVCRWDILLHHVKQFTLKRLSDTRWEAKVSSVKAVRFQIGEIHDALITLAKKEKQHNPDIAHEALTLTEQLQKFDFLVSLVVWYDILFQINTISKVMQSKSMDLCKVVELIKNCAEFLKEYRDNGLKRAITNAKELAQILEVEPKFVSAKRIRYVKRQFDYEGQDDSLSRKTPEKQFEIEFFNPLLDVALQAITERFEQLNQYADTWSFLFNIKKITIYRRVRKTLL
ncbi:hypothetical protein R5R35_010352 [Gryllus longicercus]|uniref:DUF4371 domain-containing protein n=1 Tax=Gryllus longicercus TaxID=2509291 RepID=A0AAN9W0U3_9ORTH